MPRSAIENVDNCELEADHGCGCEETNEFGGTRGNLREAVAELSTRSYLCNIRPFGAADADSTSKGKWMIWLVPERK